MDAENYILQSFTSYSEEFMASMCNEKTVDDVAGQQLSDVPKGADWDSDNSTHIKQRFSGQQKKRCHPTNIVRRIFRSAPIFEIETGVKDRTLHPCAHTNRQFSLITTSSPTILIFLQQLSSFIQSTSVKVV